MELLPDEDERSHLLDHLAALIAAAGAETFLEVSILEPTDRWFPDRWSPDAAGVELLLRRVLWYADLEHLDVTLELGSYATPGGKISHRGEAGSHDGASAWFAGIHDNVCSFGVDVRKLEDPGSLAGVLAHEVAHAYRTHHGLRDACSRSPICSPRR